MFVKLTKAGPMLNERTIYVNVSQVLYVFSEDKGGPATLQFAAGGGQLKTKETADEVLKKLIYMANKVKG